MKMRMLIALVLLGLSLHASAREVEGVALPDTVTVEGATLRLNGAGLRTMFFFRIYVAALYLEKRQWDAATILSDKGPRRIELHVVRDEVDSARFLRAFREGIEKNTSDARRVALGPRLAAFEKAFDGVKTVRRGDVVAFDWLPGQGTRISLNGKVLGNIEGEDFYQALLSIWIGEHPVMNSLKQELLGG